MLPWIVRLQPVVETEGEMAECSECEVEGWVGQQPSLPPMPTLPPMSPDLREAKLPEVCDPSNTDPYGRLLFAVCFRPFVVCRLLSAVYCLLSAGCCLPPTSPDSREAELSELRFSVHRIHPFASLLPLQSPSFVKSIINDLPAYSQ
jgi:hypothetical protein